MLGGRLQVLAKTRDVSFAFVLVLAVAISADSQKNSLNKPLYVHNVKGLWGENIPVNLELVRTIGGLNETDPSLAFGAPYDVAQDASGHIYVLDARNSQIQKISPDGKYVLSIGRKGQGPGDHTGN